MEFAALVVIFGTLAGLPALIFFYVIQKKSPGTRPLIAIATFAIVWSVVAGWSSLLIHAAQDTAEHVRHPGHHLGAAAFDVATGTDLHPRMQRFLSAYDAAQAAPFVLTPIYAPELAYRWSELP